jgi:hypothetical protein
MALGNQYDFEMHSGDTLTLNVTVQDAAGVAVDLTGATCTFGLSKQDAEGMPKGSSLASPAVTIVNAASGNVSVAIAPTDTESLAGDYYHELQVVDASANVSTVLYGTATIQKDLLA